MQEANAIIQTQVKGPWFVVNMTTRWKQRNIKRGDKPTRVIRSFRFAAKVAMELAERHPEQDWAVFECVGYCKKKSA